MLEHRQDPPRDPARVVILGAAGFVGSACAARLRNGGIETLALGRHDLDLLAEGAADRLAKMLRPDDSVVIISAQAPCKDAEMLRDNIAIMETVCGALQSASVSHAVYISSDAVYGDEPRPLSESAPRAPTSLHGVMHLAREIMLSSMIADQLAILRPTLVYGLHDPHNGYGPNRFRRLAASRQDIVLFGEGEERRDHVLVDDVAEIVARVLRWRSVGTLNIATGQVASFRTIAEKIAAMFTPHVTVRGSPRTGPMPHGGYRPFDASATRSSFPDFVYTTLDSGLARVHGEALRDSHG